MTSECTIDRCLTIRMYPERARQTLAVHATGGWLPVVQVPSANTISGNVSTITARSTMACVDPAPFFDRSTPTCTSHTHDHRQLQHATEQGGRGSNRGGGCGPHRV